VYACDRDDVATIKRLVALRALPSDWRSYFEKRLAALRAQLARAIEELDRG
jgi:hypothetical protein